MPLNVVWRSQLVATHKEQLAALLGDGFQLEAETDKEKLTPYLQDMQILIDGNPSDAALDAPNLRHVIVPWAGISTGLRDKVLVRPQLELYNSHYNAGFVAQHAVALLFACAARLVEADRLLRQGDWRALYDNSFKSLYLPGKTCLLLGYGAIGQRIGEQVRALGMKVTALRRHPDKHGDDLSKSYGQDELRRALAEADAIVCSLPHTPKTEGLLAEEAFTAMKKTAVLVNVGRGAVIDQHALYDALKERRILAAGLDVWWNYPENDEARSHTFPADAPLHELSNLVMSPHRATQVADEGDATVIDIAETVKAIARGEARNKVDVEQGY